MRNDKWQMANDKSREGENGSEESVEFIVGSTAEYMPGAQEAAEAGGVSTIGGDEVEEGRSIQLVLMSGDVERKTCLLLVKVSDETVKVDGNLVAGSIKAGYGIRTKQVDAPFLTEKSEGHGKIDLERIVGLAVDGRAVTQ